MDIYVAVMVPAYLLSVNSSYKGANKTGNNRFKLKGNDLSVILTALAGAPDQSIHVWKRDDKNGKMGRDWIKKWADEDIAKGKTPIRMKDIIRSLTSKNYKGSFYGTTGEDTGKLFHEFAGIDVGDHTPNRRLRMYVKFIAPKGVIDETEFYDLYHTKTPDPIQITRNQVREGGRKWEVVSFHNNTECPKNST